MTRERSLFLPGLVFLAGLALPLGTLDADEPPARLTYVKVFEGSLPEYTRVTIEENGQATYQDGSTDQPEAPESFRLSSAMAARLFGLAAELGYFQNLELDSGQRVAHMGDKTFLYEKGTMRAEVRYNHTKNSTAFELQNWFERIARGRYLAGQLEHQAVFDRLGLAETLRTFEREFNAGQLVDPEQFVSVLERIAKDARAMGLVKSQAQDLLRRIRGGPARLQLEYGDDETGWYYKMVLVDGGSATQESRRYGDPTNPQRLDLPETTSKRLWELARLANYFRELTTYSESPGRLRGYRLSYDAGPEFRQLVFSAPPNALLAEMVHIFQQSLQQTYFQQRLRAALEGNSIELQVVLQDLETAVRGDKLLAPSEFVPLLEGIAGQTEQHAVVRGLAERLLAQLRGGSR
ncbi:MAG: hypothetical protein ACRD35_07880 [Candidatus Acidiferrales bacterium]